MSSGELLLGVARLRAVWPILADAMQPGNARTAPAARDVDPAAALVYLRRRDQLDREARFVALRDDTVPHPPMPDAANVRALDARAAVDRAVCIVAPEAYRAATGQPLLVAGVSVERRVPAGLDAIATAAAGVPRCRCTWCAVRFHVPADLAADLADVLGRAADQAEQATGLGPFDRPLGGLDCPACGLSTMRIRLDSPQAAEWVIECRYVRCRCTGARCGCARAQGSRVPGRRHVWAPGEWPRLCDALGRSGVRLRQMLSCLA